MHGRLLLGRLIRRVGRRGSALLFFSLLDLCYGLSLLKPAAELRRSPSQTFMSQIMPLPAWALLWLAVGVICLAGAFAHRDRWAFTAAMGLKTLWGTTYLLGWLVFGVDRAWVASVIWIAMAGWVFIISTWPEAPRKAVAG